MVDEKAAQRAALMVAPKVVSKVSMSDERTVGKMELKMGQRRVGMTVALKAGMLVSTRV